MGYDDRVNQSPSSTPSSSASSCASSPYEVLYSPTSNPSNYLPTYTHNDYHWQSQFGLPINGKSVNTPTQPLAPYDLKRTHFSRFSQKLAKAFIFNDAITDSTIT